MTKAPYRCLKCGRPLAQVRADGMLQLGSVLVRQRVKVICGHCGARRTFRPAGVDARTPPGER